VARRKKAPQSPQPATTPPKATPPNVPLPDPIWWRRALVAVVAGAMLFLACANFDIWPLAWFALAPAFAVILDPRARRPVLLAFLLGLVANGGGFYWIQGFLIQFGHMPFFAALPIYLLLVGYQALTFTFFFTAVRKLRHATGWSIVWTAPVLYVAIELVVPYVFPFYLSITQAWVRPVIQVAELTGPLGVSFLLILCNAALFELGTALYARHKNLPQPTGWQRRVALAGVILVANVAYGYVRIHQVEARRAAAPKIRIGVVQANVGIHEKFRPGLAAEQLEIHQHVSQALEARGADLVVWPESSYPYGLLRAQASDYAPNDRRRIRRNLGKPLLFGALTFGDNPFPYNTALLLDENDNFTGLFDKNILMVFGEYVPYFDQLRFIKRWIPEVSNTSRGTEVTTFPLTVPRLGQTIKLGPMICYEDIFPSFGRRLAKLQPNILINVTNDAWFGHTSEPYEHLALSVYRSVELRLDLVRAVNTGVSAFVDSTGRLYAQSPSVDPDLTPHPEPAGLLEEVAVQETQTLYATVGEAFGGLCLVLACILGLIGVSRAGSPVRWPLVATGSALLVLGAAVGIIVLGGPANLAHGLGILAHMRVAVSADLAFRLGLALVPGLVAGSIAMGIVLGRRGATFLEMVLAVVAVMVLPALLLGTLEGEQAGLVISAMIAVAVARLAKRFAGSRRPA